MSPWDNTLARARACLTGEGADLDVRAGMASALLWVAGFVTAGLTAFYMFRLYFLTVEG
jgi:NADH:ubiquinone oxidoreductase subunit 5 (subunit L)/multisubunit Na+/H+ antiporter MnhA subunit